MPKESLSGFAIHEILQSLAKLQKNIGNDQNNDKAVLQGNPIIQSLAKIHDTIGKSHTSCVCKTSSELMGQVVHDLEDMKTAEAEELCLLLKSPHFKHVAIAHDCIAKHCHVIEQRSFVESQDSSDLEEWETPVRMVGLTKKSSDPLGLTVAVENDEIVVTRILHGGFIDKQGLMHVGDTICEVNGQSVNGNLDLLKKYLCESSGSFTLKIIPSYQKAQESSDIFMKCNFNFNPNVDTYIPSKEAGLAFKQNDILKIVNRDDMQWWQAHHIGKKGEVVGRAGLVPSLELQERRRFNAGQLKIRKKYRKMYKLSDYYREYTDDFLLYEEVALLPPFSRKCVLLVSHDSSIAYHIREKLVETYPNNYKAPLVTTSSSQQSNGYEVISKEIFTEEIKENCYFEFSEVKNDLFGTRYESVRNVIKSGKTCVKDVLPKNLKFLLTSEFMPYVIFLRPENDIDESLSHCINRVLPHRSVQQSCYAVHRELQDLSKSHQWVPVSWLY